MLGGRTIQPILAGSTCIEAAAGTAAATRLIHGDGVAAIVGADCSGVTAAMVANGTAPAGVLAVSPSATSPALTALDDGGLFFRTAPSDARQGAVLAGATIARGIAEVAITDTNNDDGAGLAEAFTAAFAAQGGRVAITAAHEDGKGDHAAEVAALAATGAEQLAVFGIVDQGGSGIICAALDPGAFQTFILADGMMADTLADRFGTEVDGSFGTTPGSDGARAPEFAAMAETAGITGTGPHRAEGYDAAAPIILAVQAAGTTDSAAVAAGILDVANAPGEPIGAGDLARGLEIPAVGAASTMSAPPAWSSRPRATPPAYLEMEICGGRRAFVRLRSGHPSRRVPRGPRRRTSPAGPRAVQRRGRRPGSGRDGVESAATRSRMKA